MTSPTKSGPEPFLGAHALGYAPQDCLVFEDAPAGAAQAAGCTVLGVQTTHGSLDTEIIKNLSQVTFAPQNDGISVSWCPGRFDGGLCGHGL